MRYGYPVLFVLGLAIGAVGAAMFTNAMHEREAYPHGVMAVLGAQFAALDQSVKANRCTANDLLPKFQTLRAVANDIEPAFGEDDPRFIEYAGGLRAAADAALMTPPGSCPAAAATLDRVHEACSNCHREFKD
jgi:hypothetical protein